MSESDSWVRIVASLKEDAIASYAGAEPLVTLVLRIPRRLSTPDETVRFKAKGFRPDDLRDLVGPLKKDKTVELVAELQDATLVAKFVRIDRVDYPVTDKKGVTLLAKP